nr:MAG TPA: hypothetical protein [Caudoviricetes sp.]
MSRLAIWFNIGWNNISYTKSNYRVKREKEGTTLDLASAGIAGNGCMRVGQTSSVYILPGYFPERAVGAFENLWYSPAAKMQCTAYSWGITDSHYPCLRAFPECLPYSLYIILSKKEDLRGDTAKFRGCPAYRIDRYSSGFLIRLFTYRSETAVGGINLSVKLFSVHLSPVWSSCHLTDGSVV